MKLLRLSEVSEKFRIGHLAINNMVSDGVFPQPIMMGAKRLWVEEDLDEHIKSLRPMISVKLDKLEVLDEPAHDSHLITKGKIVKTKTSVETIKTRYRGVYFLIEEDEIVYVGKSNNVYQRIGQHIYEGIKKFDHVSFIQTAGTDQELQDAERVFINSFCPKYNQK